MHRLPLGWLAIIIIIVAVTLGALLFLDTQPLVEKDPAITAQEHAWARHWIATNRLRLRGSQSGELITVVLTERETNLLANELLNRLGQGRASLRLDDGRAHLATSLALPWNPLGGFINLELTLVEDGHLPKIETARLAGLPIPGALVQTLADRALTAVESTELLQRVELNDDQIRIAYEWRPDLLERISSGFVAETDLPNLLRYQDYLTRQVARGPRRQPLQLADLLAHLLAKAGAQPPSADPIAENRALILTLAAYVNGRTIREPADSATSAKPRHPRPVLLRGRRDLSQHFMTSAALAIQGDDTLSGIMGWYKEMSDAKGGSGFSFADMAANRAGIRLARLATADRESARRVQGIAEQGLTEEDFMPTLDGLPEGIDQRTFAANFGGTNHGDYQRLIVHIDRRIETRRLFREP
ncbi:hypothetical protein CCR95_12710 [Thiocystis minor]|uniref:hypothetical protein n=1 Tax=Thiocystis minor TaxID=61597 RepID=UPI001912B617|nr:hypothetical protein [Thiocystis minor]MBK5964920.1 hypothetical protein [Thiocystis minor]